mmetsp:Transcript_20168/g.37936  ORF Transcript_20168/g.37936 Transcript_20168/m.37936 type:complete len:232 (-) Transcript_20168:733-1428(-)
MAQQERFELGGGHLVALVLDELLEPIHDEEVAGLVHGRDVARVQEAVRVYGVLRGLLVVEVALHHLRAADPQLSLLVRLGDDLLGIDVHQLRLSVFHQPARAPKHGAVHRRDQPNGRQLRHAPPLARAVQLEALDAEVRHLLAQGGGSGEDLLEAGEVELVDDGVLREEEDDGRDDVREGDLVLLEDLQEVARLKPVHDDHLRALAKSCVEDDDHAVDVEERQQTEEGVFG